MHSTGFKNKNNSVAKKAKKAIKSSSCSTKKRNIATKTKRAKQQSIANTNVHTQFQHYQQQQQAQFTRVSPFKYQFSTLNTPSPSSVVGEGSDPAFQPQTKQQQEEKSQTEQEQDDLLSQIDSVVKSYGVVLFMKGTPSDPRCGFSRRVVQILHEFDITYEACNVLESDELREAIKTYSNWPTLPQLYVKGEFVGGCDIVTQMYQSGELAQVLPLKTKKAESEETKTVEQQQENEKATV